MNQAPTHHNVGLINQTPTFKRLPRHYMHHNDKVGLMNQAPTQIIS